MPLPQPDPSNPVLPAPLFADVDAVRGDHLRANNQLIWENLQYLFDFTGRTTDTLTEGVTNLYFTDARAKASAIAAALTGYAAGSDALIAATDTILQAFGKTQGQINADRARLTLLENRCNTRWDTYAGYGGTDTCIPYFTNKNTDTSAGQYTIVNNSTNGLKITINTAGVYSVTFCANAQLGSGVSVFAGVSLNSAQLTTAIQSITAADRLALNVSENNGYTAISVTLPLAVNDVIRPHTNAYAMTQAALASFSITKIA